MAIHQSLLCEVHKHSLTRQVHFLLMLRYFSSYLHWIHLSKVEFEITDLIFHCQMQKKKHPCIEQSGILEWCSNQMVRNQSALWIDCTSSHHSSYLYNSHFPTALFHFFHNSSQNQNPNKPPVIMLQDLFDISISLSTPIYFWFLPFFISDFYICIHVA